MQREGGFVLSVSLIILAIVSIIGLSAISISSNGVIIAQNEKSYQAAFYAADAGARIGVEVIAKVFSDDFDFGATVETSPHFKEEIYGIHEYNDRDTDSPTINPDIQISYFSGNMSVGVDVDLKGTPDPLPGGGIGFGSGYDGVGAGEMASGGARAIYSIEASSAGSNNASASVNVQYRHVIGMGT